MFYYYYQLLNIIVLLSATNIRVSTYLPAHGSTELARMKKAANSTKDTMIATESTTLQITLTETMLAYIVTMMYALLF